MVAARQELLGQALHLVEGEPPQVAEAGPGQQRHLRPCLLGVRDVEEGESAGGPGVVGGEGVGDHRADVVARDVGPFQAEVGEQGPDVGGHRLLVVSALRLGGAAHAAQVHGDHPVAAGQGGHHLVPLPPGLRPAAEQDERLAAAALHVVQAGAVDLGVVAGEAAVEGGGEGGVVEGGGVGCGSGHGGVLAEEGPDDRTKIPYG